MNQLKESYAAAVAHLHALKRMTVSFFLDSEEAELLLENQETKEKFEFGNTKHGTQVTAWLHVPGDRGRVKRLPVEIITTVTMTPAGQALVITIPSGDATKKDLTIQLTLDEIKETARFVYIDPTGEEVILSATYPEDWVTDDDDDDVDPDDEFED